MGVPPWKFSPSFVHARKINLEGTEHVIPKISESTVDFLGRVLKAYEDHKEKEKDDAFKMLLELKDYIRKVLEDISDQESDEQFLEDVLQGRVSSAWEVKDHDPFLIERTSAMINSLESSYDWQPESGEVADQLISYLKSASPEEQKKIIEDIDRLEIKDIESSMLKPEIAEQNSEFINQVVGGDGRVLDFHTVDVESNNDIPEPEGYQHDDGDPQVN